MERKDHQDHRVLTDHVDDTAQKDNPEARGQEEKTAIKDRLDHVVELAMMA